MLAVIRPATLAVAQAAIVRREAAYGRAEYRDPTLAHKQDSEKSSTAYARPSLGSFISSRNG